jgi:hypothetical protein
MRLPDQFDDSESEESFLDEEFPLGDGTAQGDAIVYCPYCGESVEIALDAGGGADQRYIQDCEVCCRPWQVLVRYASDGTATVDLEPLDD